MTPLLKPTRRRELLKPANCLMLWPLSSGLTGIHLGVGQWRRATLAFAHAGLGLRSASVHAPAAYLASLGASLSACAELDFSFSADAVLASPAVVQALAALNARLPGNRGLALEKALSSRQHALSEARLMELRGMPNCLQQARPSVPLSFLKQVLPLVLFLRRHQPARPEWSLPSFSLSFELGLAPPKPPRRYGVRCAMACWMCRATMLLCVWPAESAINAATL